MNCKQGELAIIVKSGAGNEGRIVECVRLIGNAPVVFNGRRFLHKSTGPVWLVKSEGSPIKSSLGYVGYEVPVLDSCLRPIRPLDDSDDIRDIRNIPAKDIA